MSRDTQVISWSLAPTCNQRPTDHLHFTLRLIPLAQVRGNHDDKDEDTMPLQRHANNTEQASMFFTAVVTVLF